MSDGVLLLLILIIILAGLFVWSLWNYRRRQPERTGPHVRRTWWYWVLLAWGVIVNAGWSKRRKKYWYER